MNLDVYFARFFIEKDNIQLKIEFVKEYNRFGESLKTEKGIFLNNLEDIGANKITAFEDRAEMKDITDLFYITKSISLKRLFEIADEKRIAVPYEELLSINTEGVSGRVLVCEAIDEGEINHFLENFKDATEEEIKKKNRLH